MVAILALVLAAQASAAPMTLMSPAFASGDRIPDKYTMADRVGQNISLPFTWSAPPGTLSFALSLVDRHPVANDCVQWLVINIPASLTSLAEGASASMPAGALQLNNSWEDPFYYGPYPWTGTGVHPYVTTVYALNVATLGLPVDTNLDAFQAALEGKVVDSASITGYFRIGESTAASDMVLFE
jgi:hypothetical protein